MANTHALCRPPRGAGKPDGVDYDQNDPLRLGEDGRWRPDNGRPARAFIYKSGDGTHHVCVADCRCPYLQGCPLGTALDYGNDKLGIEALNVDRRPRRSPLSAAAAMKKRKRKS